MVYEISHLIRESGADGYTFINSSWFFVSHALYRIIDADIFQTTKNGI